MHDLDVWSIGNPEVTIKFERSTSGLAKVDSWVDADRELDASFNPLHEVCRRGITFPSEAGGMAFSTGEVELVQNAEGMHRLLFCQVAIGHAFVATKEDGRRDVPRGYDSLRIFDPSEEESEAEIEEIPIPDSGGSSDENVEPGSPSRSPTRGSPSRGSPSRGSPTRESVAAPKVRIIRRPRNYRHTFIVPNPSQVLPEYIVQFKSTKAADDAASEGSGGGGGGEAAPAGDGAADDDADLGSGREAGHAPRGRRDVPASREGRHDRRGHRSSGSSNGSEVSYGVCPLHPKKVVEFFCQQCHVPVCVHCKMVGTHAAGEAAHHGLIPIEVAYTTALESSAREDPLLASRREAVADALRSVREKASVVASNALAVEDLIVQKMQEAVDQLRRLTRRKANVLLAEELELRRQLDHFDWVESFLVDEQRSLEAVSFLTAWSRHASLRTQLHGTATGVKESVEAVLETVVPDLQVVGHVDVLAGDRAVARSTARDRYSSSDTRTNAPRQSEGPRRAVPNEMSAEAIIAGMKRDIRMRDDAVAMLTGNAGAALGSPAPSILIGSPVPQMMSPPGTLGSAGTGARGCHSSEHHTGGSGSAMPGGISVRQFWTNVLRGRGEGNVGSASAASTASPPASGGSASGRKRGSSRWRRGDARPGSTGWTSGDPLSSPVPLAGLPAALTPDRHGVPLPRSASRAHRAGHREHRTAGEPRSAMLRRQAARRAAAAEAAAAAAEAEAAGLRGAYRQGGSDDEDGVQPPGVNRAGAAAESVRRNLYAQYGNGRQGHHRRSQSDVPGGGGLSGLYSDLGGERPGGAGLDESDGDAGYFTATWGEDAEEASSSGSTGRGAAMRGHQRSRTETVLRRSPR